MGREYVRIVSWHVRATYTRTGGAMTLCGRFVGPPLDMSVTLPAAKSCESCARIALRQDDKG